MGQSPKQNQAHNLKDKGAQKPNRNKQTLGCQPKCINRCRRKPTGHHHVFDRPAIRRHGSGWESACFRRYQRGDATDPRRRRRQDEEEMLTRSSLQPDPNRSPDRRLEKKIQSSSINSTIFNLPAWQAVIFNDKRKLEDESALTKGRKKPSKIIEERRLRVE